ncbi:MAG: AAA family ATPase [Lachnospiraceae bacterium]|nr:AAA family ATPase [Lachnospiraceae bacterium]
MKLISCHIENFGKLSDRSVSFDDISGINVLCENNGWGKSTLANFIKVMFFGFDNEGKRSSVENERQHFKPWQGGVYGGQLMFESGGKRYIMSRTFGAKEKDDEFMLQDADTRLEVTNFSKNIGEELFQIDRASFARSVYISQNDCVTTTTDRINAKLGNLTDNTDDLNNYETAAKKIADKLNFLSKTRKTGELYKQKEKIAQLKQEIKKGEAIDSSMEGILGLKNELYSSYETLKARRSELQGRQKEISEYKDILVKKKEYEQLCDVEAKKRKDYEEKKAMFPVRIPEGEEIDKYIELEYRTSVLKKNLEFSKPEDDEIKLLSLLEKRFGEGIPNSEEIEEVRHKVGDMQTLRWNIGKSMLNEEETHSLKRFEELFAAAVPEEEKIDKLSKAWSLRCEKKNTLSSKIATVTMLKMTEAANEESRRNGESWGYGQDRALDRSVGSEQKREGTKNGSRKYTYATLTLLAILGMIGALLCFVMPSVGVGVLAADIVAVIIVIFLTIAKSRTTKRDTGNDSYSSPLTQTAPAAPPYLALQREIEDDKDLINKVENDVKNFLLSYKIPYEESSVTSDLYQLKENVRLYKRLQEKSESGEGERLKRRYNELRSGVDAFLQKYGVCSNEHNEEVEDTAEHANKEFISTDRILHYVNLIYELESSADKFTALKVRKADYEKSYGEYKKNTEDLNSFINGLKMEYEGDLHSTMQHIKKAREDCLDTESEYKEAAEAKKKYEVENSNILDAIKNTKEAEEDVSLAEIEEKLSEISAEIEKYHSNMAAYNRQLDELQERRDEITEAEVRLDELQELYDVNEKKLDTLKKTQQYLEQAKISLTAKYTQPIKEGFDKYFGILCDIESENYQLDANLEMSVLEQGMPRDTAFLSTGYQDMIGICMRMALIDAMYKDEKPFVIFDDPFVNLDEEKTRAALKLLEKIAKEYQVVYFTCNESRR